MFFLIGKNVLTEVAQCCIIRPIRQVPVKANETNGTGERMPRVSVIIISYNEREYLGEAIRSVTGQSFSDLEIIIGDDGSTDGSQEYLAELPEKLANRCPVSFYVMNRPEKNDGIIPSLRVSDNIKRALATATGDYTLILSGDDYFTDPDKICTAVEFLDKNPEYAAYVSGYEKVYDDGKKETVLPLRLSPAQYFSAHYLHISCFVFRRVSPDSLLNRFADDTGLEFSLGKGAKWAYDDQVTFAYRQRSGSIMHGSENVELDLTELMIYQDVMNDSGPFVMRAAARSRMYRPMKALIKNRAMIREETCGKYLKSSRAYPHDVLGALSSGKPRFLRTAGCYVLLFRMGVDRFCFRLAEKRKKGRTE